MTIRKQMLLAATALTLVSGVALAGSNNEAYVTQNNNGNEATITQSGLGNNLAGAAGDAMTQDGTTNRLTITQTATPINGRVTNRIGVGAIDASAGVNQTGNLNVLTATQNGAEHNAFQLQQIGNNNGITIGQSGGRSDFISAINQTGDRNAATVSQVGSLNSLGRNTSRALPRASQNENGTGVTQTGSDINATILQQGGNNQIGAINQLSDGNSARVDQVGSENKLDTLQQQQSTAGFGNTAVLLFNGNQNGLSNLSGVAAVASVASSSLLQSGKSNNYRLDVRGNANSFGASQIGDNNSVGSLVITGNTNALGIFQGGLNNEVALGTISGDRNTVGVNQLNSFNVATLNIIGPASSDNILGVRQDGGNDLSATITGSSNNIGANQTTTNLNRNAATLTVTGNNNNLSLDQLAGSQATISISGNDNNDSAFTAPLNSLVPGQVTQNGLGNDVDLTVDGNSNLFAFNQLGASNTIIGTMDGNSNQAMVVQVGASNVTSYSQIGNQNFVSVSQ